MILTSSFIFVTPHALKRFRERVDPCADYEDIQTYVKQSEYKGKWNRTFHTNYQRIVFVLKKRGRNGYAVITCYRV